MTAERMIDSSLIPHPSSLQNLQIEFGTHFADERSDDIPQRPLAIALQLRLRSDIDPEELEGLQDDRVATACHRAVVDLQSDTQRAIIVELQAIGQCRSERRRNRH